MTLDKAWKKVCSYIQTGKLPHVNAAFKVHLVIVTFNVFVLN